MNTEMVSLNASIDNMGFGQQNLACIEPWPQLMNTVCYYYPSWTCWNQPSKIEQAFKIVGKLMEKKLVKLDTVKDFVETVNEVAELL